MSNLCSTSGCTMPNTPMSFPSFTMRACLPGKNVASSLSTISYPASPPFAAPVTTMIRSKTPCTISKPDFLSLYSTKSRRAFRAPTSLSASIKTTSPTSKSFAGNGASLFAPIAFNTPCSNDERATCTSSPLGFATIAAQFPVSSLETLAKLSSCEHRIQVSTSENPSIAISPRTKSEKWFRGCCAPTVFTGGTVRLMLLYPCAMATSSAMSHACSTSDRVGGTSTRSMPVSSFSFVGSCMRQRSAAMSRGAMSTPMRPLTYFGSASTKRVM
mmetsp:Transcript_7379/g.31462  ORF Transcript_7379/g.31462 Transcript_7379/m.31462 type:complete len:272 (-) Transcript_7379:976-1791(-)